MKIYLFISINLLHLITCFRIVDMCDSELNCAQCVTKHCFFGHLQNDSAVYVSQRNEVAGWNHFIVDPGDVGVCPFQPPEPEVTTDAWVNLTWAGKSASSTSSDN
jgi:hypothetical protein